MRTTMIPGLVSGAGGSLPIPVPDAAEILSNGITLRLHCDPSASIGSAAGFTRSGGSITSGAPNAGHIDLTIPKVFQGAPNETLSYDAGTGTVANDFGTMVSFSNLTVVNNSTQSTAITFADVGLTGAEGWIWNGRASATYTNSDGPAAGSPDVADTTNDPVGYAADTSGAGSHQVQAASSNKPALHVYAGGIKSLQLGRVAGNLRYLMSASGHLDNGNPMTMVAVVSTVNTGGAALMFFTNFNPSQAGGFTYVSLSSSGGVPSLSVFDGSVGWASVYASVSLAGYADTNVIVVYHRPGPKVPPTRLRVYSMAGTLIGEASMSGTLSNYNYADFDDLRDYSMGGAVGMSADLTTKCPFMLAANQAISAPNEAALISNLVALFGGIA